MGSTVDQFYATGRVLKYNHNHSVENGEFTSGVSKVLAASFSGSVRDDDWRLTGDLAHRATQMLQNYKESEEIVKQVASNIQAGRDARAGVDIDAEGVWGFEDVPGAPAQNWTTNDVLGAYEESARWVIKQPTTLAPTLFKGALVSPSTLGGPTLKVGSRLPASLSSFSSRRSVAESYAMAPRGEAIKYRVVFQLSGAKGIYLDQNAGRLTSDSMEEWLVSGSFKITSVVDSEVNNRPVQVVTLSVV